MFIKNVYKWHARKHLAFLRLGYANTCFNMCHRCWLLWSRQFCLTGKSPPFTFMDIGFFSRELQRNLLFYARLTWLRPSKPFCSRKLACGTSHWNKLGLMYLPPAHRKVTHLTTMRPNMQEWRKQGHFVWCGFFLQCSEIESYSFEILQSQFGTPRISLFEFLSCTACWWKKQGAGMLTSNA